MLSRISGLLSVSQSVTKKRTSIIMAGLTPAFSVMCIGDILVIFRHAM